MKFNLFKKKKINPKDIPQEILDDFNEAERRMAESKGEEKPYKILFDITMEIRTLKGGQ